MRTVRIIGALGGKECGCKQKWEVEVAERKDNEVEGLGRALSVRLRVWPNPCLERHLIQPLAVAVQ